VPAADHSDHRTAPISPIQVRAGPAKCPRDLRRRLNKSRSRHALETRPNHRPRRAPRPNATWMSAVGSTAPLILRIAPTSLMAAVRVESANDRRIAARERLKTEIKSACRCASPVAGAGSVSATPVLRFRSSPETAARSMQTAETKEH
jgi:hypothetical protein